MTQQIFATVFCSLPAGQWVELDASVYVCVFEGDSNGQRWEEILPLLHSRKSSSPLPTNNGAERFTWASAFQGLGASVPVEASCSHYVM